MEQIELKDVGMLERVSRERYVTSKDEGDYHRQQSVTYVRDTLPEEIMSKIEEHVGDGEGSVVVSAELATSVDFGCKAGAFVSIKLACNNTVDDALAVHDIIQPLVAEAVEEDYKHMEHLRDRILGNVKDDKPAAAEKISKSSSSKRRRPSFKRK